MEKRFNMTPAEKKWANTLVPYIVARMNDGQSYDEAVAGAMDDYTAIIEEAYVGNTDRMRKAKDALCTLVFAHIHIEEAVQRAPSN